MKKDLSLKVYCDGGARGNPGPAASAFIVEDSTGKVLFENGIFIGSATNNQAEYRAVIEALHWITNNTKTLTTLSIYLDSQLVVNQVNGSFKVKEPHLRILHSQVIDLLQQHNQVNNLNITGLYYIPRSQNFRADAFVNKILNDRSG